MASRRTLVPWVAACVAAGAARSAKTVDLGNNPNVQANPIYVDKPPPTGAATGDNARGAPFRIVDGEQDIDGDAVQFTVDSGHLYWLHAEIAGTAYRYRLDNCAIDNCALTLASSDYRTEAELSFGTILTNDDMVYWTQGRAEGDGYSTLIAPPFPSAGISEVTWPSPGIATFQVSDGMLYTLDKDVGNVQRCTGADCAATAEQLSIPAPPDATQFDFGQSTIFGQDSDYLYLVDKYEPASYTRLGRVRKDFSAPFEVITELSQTLAGPMAVCGENVCWAETVALGRLLSCPKSGCGSAATTLTSGLNLYLRAMIAADDSSVYILDPPQIEDIANADDTVGTSRVMKPGHILKCPITGCDAPQVLYTSTTEVSMTNLLVDDRYVYFRGNGCAQSYRVLPQDGLYNNCAFIAAIPK